MTLSLASTMVVQDEALEERMRGYINQAAEELPDANNYPGIHFPKKGVRILTKEGKFQVNFKIIRNYEEGTARWEYENMRKIPADESTGIEKRAKRRKRRTKAQIEADNAAAAAAKAEADKEKAPDE